MEEEEEEERRRIELGRIKKDEWWSIGERSG